MHRRKPGSGGKERLANVTFLFQNIPSATDQRLLVDAVQ